MDKGDKLLESLVDLANQYDWNNDDFGETATGEASTSTNTKTGVTPKETTHDSSTSKALHFATPTLFIADIQKAKCQGAIFTHKHIRFNKVFICGHVVSAKPHKEKSAIIVDDGTDEIICLLEKSKETEKLKNKILSGYTDVRAELSKNATNPVLKAAHMMAKISVSKMERIPFTYADVNLGETVSVWGKLSEYNDKRYIFIDKIYRHEPHSSEFVEHLKYLDYLYKNVYE